MHRGVHLGGQHLDESEADTSALGLTREFVLGPIKELEDTLASPDLYREGAKVQEIMQDFEDAKLSLAQLYEHWEEAVELNG